MERLGTSIEQPQWHDLETDFWSGVANGVALGMGAYPFALAASTQLLAWVRHPISLLPKLLIALAWSSLGALVAYFLAKLLASMYGMLYEKWLATRFTSSPQLWEGAFIGGLVALTLIVPFVLPTLAGYERSGLYIAVLRSLGFVILATVLAQAGAIWGGRNRLISQGPDDPLDWKANLPSFSIAMVMWLMVGLCFTFTALKLTGFPLDAIVIFLIIWFAAQGMTMVGLLVFERLYARLFESRHAV